jgi:hypothetical protein
MLVVALVNNLKMGCNRQVRAFLHLIAQRQIKDVVSYTKKIIRMTQKYLVTHTNP